MGTPPVLDLEGLLAPIGDAGPCGSDPRLDPSPVSAYQILKDARHAAADAERSLERGFAEESDAKSAEAAGRRSWQLILDQAPMLLGATAKDLEVAAWLTEALLRHRQLAGLRDGLKLLTGLTEQYWDGVFPLPDEDGIETRLVPIAALSGGDAEGRLITPLKKLPLTEGDDPAPISLWQYESAAAGGADGSATIDALTAGLQRSSEPFVRDLFDDASACLDATAQFEALLAARCGDDAPSFLRLRETLSGVLDAVKTCGPPLLATLQPVVPATIIDAEQTEQKAAAPIVAAVMDRQAAFQQLLELAGFFRRTEPHSPIAYAIENLVRRGRMTFPELVEELIADGNARRDYYVNAGIQPPEDR